MDHAQLGKPSKVEILPLLMPLCFSSVQLYQDSFQCVRQLRKIATQLTDEYTCIEAQVHTHTVRT